MITALAVVMGGTVLQTCPFPQKLETRSGPIGTFQAGWKIRQQKNLGARGTQVSTQVSTGV